MDALHIIKLLRRHLRELKENENLGAMLCHSGKDKEDALWDKIRQTNLGLAIDGLDLLEDKIHEMRAASDKSQAQYHSGIRSTLGLIRNVLTHTEIYTHILADDARRSGQDNDHGKEGYVYEFLPRSEQFQQPARDLHTMAVLTKDRMNTSLVQLTGIENRLAIEYGISHGNQRSA